MDAVIQKAIHSELHCPKCNSQALYKYGKTKSRKQRFICLICGRQFTPDASRKEVKNKPFCTKCGGHMHLYKRIGDLLRFRCAQYPLCRTYTKKMAEHEMPAPH
ncbi:MAG: IS1 family transposase [Dissulfurispiraceae bacterium]